MGLEICELDPACFLTGPGLTWQAAIKKTKVRLDLLIDIDTFFKKSRRRYQKSNMSRYSSICKS